jgi:ribonuclease P protein component
VLQMANQFGLGKEQRLKSQKVIEELFNGGKSFSSGSIRVHYLFTENGPVLQFGAGASTRNFKKSVDRNKIKRRLREAWRLQNLPLTELLLQQNHKLAVFFIYSGKELPEYKVVFDSTTRAISRLEKIINSVN